MFVLCPHCQYLVTVDPRSGRPPAACPSCGKPMEGEAQVVAETPEVAENDAVMPDAPAVESAPAEAAPVEPEPEPEPAPSARNADDFIAAMAQKPPRKARASKTADKPAKRKREPEPKPAPAATPHAPPKPARVPGPSLSVRVAALFKSLKPTPKPKVAPPAAKAEPATEETKKKASVKPVPSLRERAARRAAEAQAASVVDAPVAETTPIEASIDPIAIETAPIEFIPLAQTPVEAALAVEALRASAPAPAPVAESAPEPAPEQAPEPPAPTPAPVPPEAPIVPLPTVKKPRATTTAPSFARTRAGLRGAMPARWTSLATIGALSLLLALQLLLAQRDALAASARWRPTISALCGVLQCTLPAWRDPESFTMLSRDVRPHATAAGTLQIDASFRNDARWAQAWPRLVVTLSDIDGRVLGTRAFTAREYLGDGATTQSTLAPGQTAAISLAVVEPAPGVVAFSFEFR